MNGAAERMHPPFIMEIAVEPKCKADQEKLLSALTALRASDPSFGFSFDSQSGQTILKGMSELQLDIKVSTLKSDHHLDLNLGAPQVAYRETLARRVEVDETYKKQTGDMGQFAKVKIIFEPNPAGTGSSFESTIVDGAVPENYIPGVKKGITDVMMSGCNAGLPVVGVKVTLIDGAFHDRDSSELAFEICARAAFHRALKDDGILIEPIMKVEVTAPEDYKGSISGDLRSRRGQLQGQDMRGNAVIINALVPLANMFGYVNQLRSFSQGRANYSMQFDHYAPVLPPLGAPDGKGPFSPAAAMRVGSRQDEWINTISGRNA